MCDEFWTFDEKFFESALKTPPFHYEMVEFFEKSNEFAVIAAPRGHAKTTRLSIRHNLWDLIYNEPYILLVSETYDQSVNILSAIKYQLEYNEELRRIYGIKFIKENVDDIMIETVYGRRRIAGRGSRQSLRGVIDERENRPTLIVFDDIEEDKRIKNPVLRDEDMSWFWSVLVPARAKHGRIRGVGTILHKDGLLNNLMKHWPSLKYDAIVSEGQSLWPELMTYENLRDLEKKFTEMGQRHKFYCEYRNNPISPEDAEFKPKWVYISPLAREIENKLIITSTIDLAISKKETACYTAITTCAWTPSTPSDLWVLDVRRGRWGVYELFDQMIELKLRYRTTFHVEKAVYEEVLEEVVMREQQRLRVQAEVEKRLPPPPLRVEALQMKNTPDAKEKRIRALFVLFARGQVTWTKDFPILREELETFPHGITVDVADALSMQIHLNKRSPSQVKDTPKRDEGGWLIDQMLERANAKERKYMGSY